MERKDYAIIHITIKELGLSDEEYRDILEKICGVRSSKDLNEQSFKNLLKYFVKSKFYQKKKLGITYKQRSYIKYLNKDLKWDKTHFVNFIHKYYAKEKLEEFNKKEAGKLIESLKNIKKRKKD